MAKLKLVGPSGKEYIPLPTQLLAHMDPRRYVYYSGGYGSGKSMYGISSGIQLTYQYPKNFGVVVRKTFPDLENSTIPAYLDWLPPDTYEYNKSKHLITVMNGSKIKFMSADDPGTFRSMEIGWYHMEEANYIDKSAHDQLFARLRSQHVPPHTYRGIYTSNPVSKNHWLYQLFKVTGDPDMYAAYKAPSMENKDNLPDGYIETLAAGMTPEEREIYLGGEYLIECEGARVYADFLRKLHVIINLRDKYNPFLPVIRGWDFGFNHPACVWLQVDQDGRIKVLHHKLGHQIKLEKFAQQCLAESLKYFPEARQWADFCDPAGNQKKDVGDSSVEELSKVIGHFPVFRTDNRAIEYGVNEIRKLMSTLTDGQPNFQIDHRCDVLIDGFLGGYHYDDKFPDVIKKDGYYDHLQDALRYAIINLNGYIATSAMSNQLIRYNDYTPRNSFTGY